MSQRKFKHTPRTNHFHIFLPCFNRIRLIFPLTAADSMCSNYIFMCNVCNTLPDIIIIYLLFSFKRAGMVVITMMAGASSKALDIRFFSCLLYLLFKSWPFSVSLLFWTSTTSIDVVIVGVLALNCIQEWDMKMKSEEKEMMNGWTRTRMSWSCVHLVLTCYTEQESSK